MYTIFATACRPRRGTPAGRVSRPAVSGRGLVDDLDAGVRALHDCDVLGGVALLGARRDRAGHPDLEFAVVAGRVVGGLDPVGELVTRLAPQAVIERER